MFSFSFAINFRFIFYIFCDLINFFRPIASFFLGFNETYYSGSYAYLLIFSFCRQPWYLNYTKADKPIESEQLLIYSNILMGAIRVLSDIPD